MSIYPVLLAGGSGTRLWPLSRDNHPKQFLNINSKSSLFQETAYRLDSLQAVGIDVKPPIIVCSREYSALIRNQLELIGKSPTIIICEPTARNTAPALTLATEFIASVIRDSDAIALVMPVDHIISNRKAFSRAGASAAALANKGFLTTFGITPESPETGFILQKEGLDC